MKRFALILTLASFALVGCQRSQSEANTAPATSSAPQAAAITVEQSKSGRGNVNSVRVGDGASATTVYQGEDDSVTVMQSERSEVHVIQSVKGDGKANAVTVTGPASGSDARGGITIKQSASGSGNVNSVVIR